MDRSPSGPAWKPRKHPAGYSRVCTTSAVAAAALLALQAQLRRAGGGTCGKREGTTRIEKGASIKINFDPSPGQEHRSFLASSRLSGLSGLVWSGRQPTFTSIKAIPRCLSWPHLIHGRPRSSRQRLRDCSHQLSIFGPAFCWAGVACSTNRNC